MCYARIGGRRFRVFCAVVRFALELVLEYRQVSACHTCSPYANVNHVRSPQTAYAMCMWSVFEVHSSEMRTCMLELWVNGQVRCEVPSDDTVSSDKFIVSLSLSLNMFRCVCAVLALSVRCGDRIASEVLERVPSLPTKYKSEYEPAMCCSSAISSATGTSVVCCVCALECAVHVELSCVSVQLSCVSAISVQKLHQS